MRLPLILALLSLTPLGSAQSRGEPQRVFVELNSLPPSSVLQFESRRLGQVFDKDSYEIAVFDSQRNVLDRMRAAGHDARVTVTPLTLAFGRVVRPDRFLHLINGMGLELDADAIDWLRRQPDVKQVTLDRPLQLLNDNSVEYVRANDGPGNKTIFSRDGGAAERFDGSGQVIAILDTGIEHTHPSFDTRFEDANYEQRTGDARPVRLAGQPFQEGTNHPKVVYFLALTGSSNEDDVGHGTHGATDSAGLKVVGPGLDRIPGNGDDVVIEGVAPGALLMNYKICETLFTCVGTANIVTAMEDALSPTDPAGNPKPIATVINMSFGGSGNADSPSSVASDNAARLGCVMVSSAGNSGPGEQTIGAPAAGRRVIAVGATNDPGAFANELDVMLANPLRYGIVGASTGGQDDTELPKAPQDLAMKAHIMAGAPDVTFGLGQHYVYVGVSDQPGLVPDEVSGCIALALRGSTVDLGVSGTGTFANKVAQCTAKGAIAVLVMNNEPGELEATTAGAATIPAYGISMSSGEYLRDSLGFQSVLFDKDVPATWGTISSFPIRINAPDPATFTPATTGFSSRGPIELSRYVKPDITAPGQDVYGATIAAGGVSTGGGTMSDPSRFISVSGTSFSGPHVAGGAALLREALLDLAGEATLSGPALRSGGLAVDQLAQLGIVTQSQVRAALQNTATNLRAADGVTPIANSDDRTFLHEIGSGLMHLVEAVDARALMGTNVANGDDGPDDSANEDFLPTHSFGEKVVIDTGVSSQVDSVTVTVENLSGASAGGTYTLSIVDVGNARGDVTKAVTGTTGFQVSLSAGSVSLGSDVGDRATFDVTVDVDGRNAPLGLGFGGADVNGIPSTEFLWYVVATSANGEVLRMPFSYRALSAAPDPHHAQPFLSAIEDDASPDWTATGVDRDGRFRLSWSYPEPPALAPCAFVVEEATGSSVTFSDDAEEVLVSGMNSGWSGDETWTTAVHPDTLSGSFSPVYADEQDVSLTSTTPIALAEGVRATLSFASFEDIEDDFDYGFVEVSGDGSTFIPLAAFTGAFSGERNVDLSGFAGQSIQIRFRFVTDELVSAPLFLGWFIDDIRIEVSDFAPIATLGGGATSYDVSDRLGTPVKKGAQLAAKDFLYRVRARFGVPCNQDGPPSNLREIRVDRTRPLK